MTARQGVWPFVTVSVLAFERPEALCVVLRATLEQLDYPEDRVEVIVADNGSSDDTAEILRSEFPAVELVKVGENVGAAGWNVGFAAGRGDYFLQLDQDCHLVDDGLKLLVQAAEEHDADLVSCRTAQIGHENYVFNDEFNVGLLSYWGGSVLLRRRALEFVGGYDRRIFLWGFELDFTMRLLDRGLRHAYVHEVVSLHDKPPLTLHPSLFNHSMRALSYTAAKAMTPVDASRAVLNLVTTIAIEGLRRREYWSGARSLAAGVHDGIRHRAPVRPEISALYRRNYVDFASPLRNFRGPRSSLRERVSLGAAATRTLEERQRFWRRRPSLYPQESSSLAVCPARHAGPNEAGAIAA